MLETLGRDLLDQPPYSPDLDPSDFRIFGSLKKAMSGLQFNSNEEVQEWVTLWLAQLGPDVWRAAISDMPIRWHKCIDRDGEYVEG